MLNRLWWRVEWALWQQLLPRYWHAWIWCIVIQLLVNLKGIKVANHWMWNNTPYPAGPPFIRQYKVAFEYMFASKAGLWKIMQREDDRFDVEWDNLRRGKRADTHDLE